MIRFSHLRVFVATTRDQVPCQRYISVDGSVPGAAVTWDHHVTGEAINMDAMPDLFDATDFDGVGTTMADADALASAVAVLGGGKAALEEKTRRVLEAASHWCDHLRVPPGVDSEVARLGKGLNVWVGSQLRNGRPFADLCREVAVGPIPYMELDRRLSERVTRLIREGRLHRDGPVAWMDLRGRRSVPPDLLYQRHSCPVMVIAEEHEGGGMRYTVGVNLRVSCPDDLGPALRALAEAEFVRGPPALSPEPKPGAENWGGRRTVFGSPWNYGSRLGPEEVRGIIGRALGLL